MSSTLPDLGAVFWPVGSGDSTTIVVDEDTNAIVQVDLRDLAKADDDTSGEYPVIDELVAALPTGADGKPYLALFVLTHADKDHCCGFKELLEQVTIGELWATPRLWREYTEDADAPELCEDAKAFQEESIRRVTVVLDDVAAGRDPVSGDRIRIVGYDTDHDKHAYAELPEQYKASPGDRLTMIDGTDHEGRFAAFIHAPFDEDCAGERNETSLSMQVTLTSEDGNAGKLLLFGDLSHDTIMKIFNYSEEVEDRREYLEWDLLQAPHHCSKYVMYKRVGDLDVRQDDILDAFEDHALPGAVVVASSAVIPPSDKANANPPHKKAADRYREIVDAGNFVCTMEWPNAADPSPVVFGVDADGARIFDDQVVELASKSLVEHAAGGRSRLAVVAAAASRVGVLAASVTPVAGVVTDGRSGPERVQDAVVASRGTEKTPNEVGFGCD